MICRTSIGRTAMRVLLTVLAVASVLMCAGCSPSEAVFERLREAESMDAWQIGVTLAFATVVSEDLTCITGGVIAANGLAPFWVVALGCFLGIWFGDVGLYWLGRIGGKGLLSRPPLRWWLRPRRVEQGRQLFLRHGGKLIVTSRFLPGSRYPVYLAAGMLRYSFWLFGFWMAVAGIVWAPLLAFCAMLAGEVLLHWFATYEKIALVAVPLIIVAVWMGVQMIEYFVTHRGRRLLYGAWRRFWEWEFWPMWRFYPPVLLYLLWLGVRHRRLTLFTATNPAMPHGGFALESKRDILTRLSATEIGRERVARFVSIPEGESEARMAVLEEFLAKESISFPVVLKPDLGERGQGVAVVRSREWALRYLETCRHEVIAQEFVEGREFGVFYYRFPGEEEGHLLSVAEKSMPTVTGDGERTMEELILDHPRGVRMAKYFLGRWAAHLVRVPEKGEEVPLTNLGTHCRGAVFHDARGRATGELRAAIDELSRSYEGFYFGRYDLRVASAEDLERGQRWKVLELNGVSSESTHIYEPGYPLWKAYRDLFDQWRIAYAIGAANRERGVEPSPARELWRTIRQHARHEWFETHSEPSVEEDVPDDEQDDRGRGDETITSAG